MKSLTSPITDMLVALRIIDRPKKIIARYTVPLEHTRKVLELFDETRREINNDPWLRLAGYELWTYIFGIFPELSDDKGLELDFTRADPEGWFLDLSTYRKVDIVRFSK